MLATKGRREKVCWVYKERCHHDLWIHQHFIAWLANIFKWTASRLLWKAFSHFGISAPNTIITFSNGHWQLFYQYPQQGSHSHSIVNVEWTNFVQDSTLSKSLWEKNSAQHVIPVTATISVWCQTDNIYIYIYIYVYIILYVSAVFIAECMS